MDKTNRNKLRKITMCKNDVCMFFFHQKPHLFMGICYSYKFATKLTNLNAHTQSSQFTKPNTKYERTKKHKHIN